MSEILKKLVVKDENPEPIDYSKLKLFAAWALIDGVLIAILLLVFAYFHHGRVLTEKGEGVVAARDGSVYAGCETDDSGVLSGVGAFDFGAKFDFNETVTEGDMTVYKTAKYNVSITRYSVGGKNAYVADIYISDVALLRAVMANDSYGRGQRENVAQMARRSDALIAITGDNYSERGAGAVVRNGVLYSMDVSGDTYALYWSGEAEAIPRDEFDAKTLMEKGAYQAWNGGTILVSGGKIPEKLKTDMSEACPRAAIGCFEPGHYCFFITEADTEIADLALTMRNLGCDSAYSLYGGRLAAMTDDNGIINAREGDRECADLIIIGK